MVIGGGTIGSGPIGGSPLAGRKRDVGSSYVTENAVYLVNEDGAPITTENGDLIIVGPQDDALPELEVRISSADWTGLSAAISPQNATVIRERTLALQQAIMQSEADIDTRTDACKRVEAVVLLLEAPNVPWREVVGLLNHPSVTAILAAINLIQFIVGFGS